MNTPTPLNTLGDQKLMRRIITGFAALFFLSGLFITLNTVLQARDAYISKFWPSVNGEITLSEIVKEIRYSSSISSEAAKSTITYAPNIHYRYKVNGTAYSNNRIRFSAIGDGANYQAKQLTKKYSMGTAVNVYYAPEDPFNSVLEPSINIINILAILGGIVFSLIGIFLYKYREFYVRNVG